jgi:GT2 family glycosyltransferase
VDPAASVVVATYNRRERLHQLLDALAAQRDAPPFEVVVVDDASTDGTFDSLQGRTGDPFRLVALRQPVNSGPAAARNRGWRVGVADLICFTDDDCLPVPCWLASLAAGAATVDIAQGRTMPNPAHVGRRGPFSRTLTVPFEQGFYETCNVAYRRAVLERLGGFDESFRFPYGEDTDLAWRAKELGAATTAFVDDALVLHEIWPSHYLTQLKDMRRREGLVLLFRKHPQLRHHFGTRVFFREVHPPTVAAAAALAVLAGRPRSPARWAATVGAGLWYAWVCHLVRPKPRRRSYWAAVVPLAFVADVYEVAVMAASSVKYRTLLL